MLLSATKLLAGYLLNASSLIADGFNNLSDIVGNVALLIGLHLASQPADANHKFGHWKIEDLSSLVTSFIMFLVGFQVLIHTIKSILVVSKLILTLLGLLSVSFQLLLC